MKKLTYEYVNDYIVNNSNCELISKDYKGVDFNLEFKCECGEIFKRNFYNFRKYEKRCLSVEIKKMGRTVLLTMIMLKIISKLKVLSFLVINIKMLKLN